MLLGQLLVPFLAFVSPFQNMVVDDFRAIRLNARPFAIGNHRKETITGIVVTSVLVGHHIFRSEPLRDLLLLEDTTAARSSRYVERRLCKPYISSLLRTQCLAQKIPTPPAPTCVNKAVSPSFEYAEKSPVPPAFPRNRQMCSLQPTVVFVGSSMTFLNPPTSANILVFPEAATSTPCRFSCLVSPLTKNALVEVINTLATALGLLLIWVALVAIVIFRPSVYKSAHCTAQGDQDLEVNLVCDYSSILPLQRSSTDVVSRTVLNPGAARFIPRSSQVSVHVPAFKPRISISNIPDVTPLSSIQGSTHASDSRSIENAPEHPKTHSTLNPAAQAFLPNTPKFFMQNYHSSRLVVKVPPPKKRRVRSPQTLEKNRLKREAKLALAQAAEESGSTET